MQPATNLQNRLAGVVFILLALLGGGAYWYYSHQAEAQSNRSMADANLSAVPMSAETPPPAASATDEIVYPQDMWSSAGLEVAEVEESVLSDAIELTGKIALNEDKLAHIFPLVDGRVDEVKVQFGQRVKKGELLVIVQSKEVGQGMLQLYQDRQKLRFAESRSQWRQAVEKNALALIGMMRSQASIDEIEKSLKDRSIGEYREKLMTAYLTLLKARANQERLAPLSQTGAVPARQVLEAESDRNIAQATLQSLLEQITQDTAQATRLAAQEVMELETLISVSQTNLEILGFSEPELENIEPSKKGEELSHYPVTAPFDGTVITKDVVLLERVGPEQQILTIADLSTVWVAADIYETHLPLLARLSDQTVRLRCEAWPDKSFEAQIFYTGDVVQETTRTISLRALAPNSEGLLKPGMFVTVELPSLDTHPVIQVPQAAIQDHEGKSFVFVQTGQESFQRRDVTLGRRNRRTVEILSGLQPHEKVVVSGGFGLKSKMLSDLLQGE
ncbi:MAG: efflux RND transporter periplasmic adaptor subunit [Planctomycetota bacterium]|nr:MAG: efflux RND transporter periplasmic adaptor subunit [Planctomycetota bacterium]